MIVALFSYLWSFWVKNWVIRGGVREWKWSARRHPGSVLTPPEPFWTTLKNPLLEGIMGGQAGEQEDNVLILWGAKRRFMHWSLPCPLYLVVGVVGVMVWVLVGCMVLPVILSSSLREVQWVQCWGHKVPSTILNPSLRVWWWVLVYRW